jgi:hypothetical protein
MAVFAQNNAIALGREVQARVDRRIDLWRASFRTSRLAELNRRHTIQVTLLIQSRNISDFNTQVFIIRDFSL